MKKIVCILLAVMFIASLAACSGKVVSTGTTSTEAAQKTDAEKETEAAKSAGANTNYVDLTEMSSTMIYSEVQNMMMKPDDYVGKTVKMNGAFSVTEVEGKRYYACIIKDATACCAQGIEFDWEGDHSYPDDYPKEGEEITVTGTFNTYMEGKQKYCELQKADVQF